MLGCIAIRFERRAKVGTEPGHRIRTSEIGFATRVMLPGAAKREGLFVITIRSSMLLNRQWESEDN